MEFGRENLIVDKLNDCPSLNRNERFSFVVGASLSYESHITELTLNCDSRISYLDKNKIQNPNTRLKVHITKNNCVKNDRKRKKITICNFGKTGICSPQGNKSDQDKEPIYDELEITID